jgi:hypothetical protein
MRPNAGHGHIILRFLDYTQRCTTVGRTPLDDCSPPRRAFEVCHPRCVFRYNGLGYVIVKKRHLTTHNTHNRQTSMPPVGFEPTISAGERPQTSTLDRAATRTGTNIIKPSQKKRTKYPDCDVIPGNSENEKM